MSYADSGILSPSGLRLSLGSTDFIKALDMDTEKLEQRDMISASSSSSYGLKIESMCSHQLELINEIKNFEDNWDSYQGKKADPQSVRLCEAFLLKFSGNLKDLNTHCSHFPEFCLAPDGILGFEWNYTPSGNLFARFYSPQKIEYSTTENDEVIDSNTVENDDFIEIWKDKIQEMVK